MRKGRVQIDGETYVVFSTIEDFKYGDLSTAVHICKESVWDSMKFVEDADEFFIQLDLFEMSFQDMKELVEDLE